MTYTTTLSDSPYALTTHAIVRLDPSPGRQAAPPVLSPAKPEVIVSAQTDEANISHASILIAHALTLSDVRAERVTDLRQAIASGTYRIPSTDLAEKLFQTLQF